MNLVIELELMETAQKWWRRLGIYNLLVNVIACVRFLDVLNKREAFKMLLDIQYGRFVYSFKADL
jgi:hypothetical protein